MEGASRVRVRLWAEGEPDTLNARRLANTMGSFVVLELRWAWTRLSCGMRSSGFSLGRFVPWRQFREQKRATANHPLSTQCPLALHQQTKARLFAMV